MKCVRKIYGEEFVYERYDEACVQEYKEECAKIRRRVCAGECVRKDTMNMRFLCAKKTVKSVCENTAKSVCERYGEECVRKYTAKKRSCMRERYDEACVQEYKAVCVCEKYGEYAFVYGSV